MKIRLNIIDDIYLNPDKDFETSVILHFCENCKTELCGTWTLPYRSKVTDEFIDTLAEDIIRTIYIKECPICKSKLDFFESKSFVNISARLTKVMGREHNIDIEEASYNNSKRYNQFYVENQNTLKYPKNSLNSIREYVFFNKDTFENYISEKVNNKINNLIDTCEEDVLFNVSTEKIIKSKNNTEELKVYLKNLCTIESSIYSVTKRLKELYEAEFRNSYDIPAEKYYYVRDKYKEKYNLQNQIEELQYQVDVCEVNNFMTYEVFSYRFPYKKPPKPKAPTSPAPPVLATPNLFNRKKVEAENIQKMEAFEKIKLQYEKEKQVYDAQCVEYQNTIEELKRKHQQDYKKALEEHNKANAEILEQSNFDNALILELNGKCKQIDEDIEEIKNNPDDFASTAIGMKSLILKEIEIAEELFRKLYKCRSELYSYDIIFNKYRDFVAITSIYEYFMSGRCISLEGHEGAYNLFENERRQDLIISQLTQVITSLEQIKQNQYVIYNELTNINKGIARLERTMASAVTAINNVATEVKKTREDMNTYLEKIAENTDVIAYNTERTAYYSKLNSQLTNALGYLVAFK